MKEKIKQYAKQLNISDTGICRARVYTELSDILVRYETPYVPPVQKRLSPFEFVPDAKSVIMCAFNYFSGSGTGNISKYARGADYHRVIKGKLERLCGRIKEELGREFSHFIFCDNSPLCDKYLAYLSGLGVFGENRLLIHPVYGSYIFLGGIVTNLELDEDKPLSGGCAKCGKCAAACPGDAIACGFDASRCASYLLQKKGALSSAEREIVRRCGMVWGCDICIDVCPHNKNVPATDIEEFCAKIYSLEKEQLLSGKDFKNNFKDSAFSWRGREVLLRNIEIIED